MNPEFICPVTQSIMIDPVSAPCGHTFDRSTLVNIDAHRSTHGLWKCPTCRAAWPSTFTPAAPSNYVLKALISSGQTSSNSSSSGPETESAEETRLSPPPIQITANRVQGTDEVHISLFVPESQAATMPTLFIDCLDTSGSMGSSSVDSTQSTTDAASFSRADLVQHSVATQIELLRPYDELAIIRFDDNAEILLEPTKMTPVGRGKAKLCIPQIKPRGGTNIWAGLHKAYTIAARPENAKKNIVIIFQTDGEPTTDYIPPKGIAETFRSWLDSRPELRVTLHTVGYGFGSALDMPLLRRLAEIGKGTANYVPDGSMIGTVFIHLLANLMTCLYRGVRINIPDLPLTIPVGYLQGGQSRDFIIRTSEIFREISVMSDNEPTKVATISSCGLVEPATMGFHRVHATLVEQLAVALQTAEQNTASGVTPALLAPLIALCRSEAADPRVAALLTDLTDTDPNKGQIGKAFASPTAFSRWGRHYVAGVLSGHRNQWPINFKDEGSTIYGAPDIRELIDRGNLIFIDIPPPTPSCESSLSSSYSSSPSASRYYSNGLPRPPNTPSNRVSSMATVHSPIGPCFLGASRVKMVDGSEKRCDQIRPGDIDTAGYVIAKVIKTLVPYADIVRLENTNLRPNNHAPLDNSGGFTLWHPVHYGGEWVHPATIGSVVRVDTDAIYNFVLEWNPEDVSVLPGQYRPERPGVLIINGLMTCTMGHDMTGPVIGHPYFGAREPGKRNIIDDLRATRGWASGTIVWRNAQVIHDPVTGFICGMTAEEGNA